MGQVLEAEQRARQAAAGNVVSLDDRLERIVQVLPRGQHPPTAPPRNVVDSVFHDRQEEPRIARVVRGAGDPSLFHVPPRVLGEGLGMRVNLQFTDVRDIGGPVEGGADVGDYGVAAARGERALLPGVEVGDLAALVGPIELLDRVAELYG